MRSDTAGLITATTEKIAEQGVVDRCVCQQSEHRSKVDTLLGRFEVLIKNGSKESDHLLQALTR